MSLSDQVDPLLASGPRPPAGFSLVPNKRTCSSRSSEAAAHQSASESPPKRLIRWLTGEMAHKASAGRGFPLQLLPFSFLTASEGKLR